MLSLNEIKRTTIILVTTIAFSYQCAGQDSLSDIKGEIDALKKEQATIQNDIRMIKTLVVQKLSAPTTPEVNVKGVEIALENSPVRGNNAAQLVLIEFTDFQCPYCGRYTHDTLPDIVGQYVDSGRIAYSVVNRPLANHNLASKAAEASLCANDQGKYWEMHEKMMSNQDELGKLAGFAAALNLDIAQFEDCLKTNKYANVVSQNIVLATKLKISSVPSFVLASRDPSNPWIVKGISYVRGAQPFEVFRKAIDTAIASIP